MHFIDTFWGTEVTGKPFIPFSMPHLIGVAGILFCLILLMQTRHEFSDAKTRRKIEVVLGTLLLIQQALLYGWYITSGNFSLAESLPLYSCRIAILASAYILLSGKKALFDIVYYWGLVGGIIALITPDTSGFGPPHIMYIQYFLGHGTLLVSIAYLIVAHGLRPTKASLFKAYRVTSLYFVGVFAINKLVGGNYSYLNGKPSTPTLLDALPPYPYYIPVILAAMFILFFLAYLPFARTQENAHLYTSYKLRP